MTDVDMFLFIEKGLRAGISYIAKRLGEANNKYLSGYDSSKPSKCIIMYPDANNLYGYAMSQCLPTGGFRWMTEKQIQKVNLAACTEHRKKSMILEVDLEYPKELHEMHNDYPLAAEKMKVTKEMLFSYCKNIQDKFGINIGQVAKLIPTIAVKKNFVVHYRNLQLYLSLQLNLRYVKESMLDNGKNEKTAKEVRKYVIKKNITHENYKDCLLNGKQMLHSMRTIRSDHHQIGSYQLNKISLSWFDDKRYIHEDGIHSYAYGHCQIKTTRPSQEEPSHFPNPFPFPCPSPFPQSLLRRFFVVLLPSTSRYPRLAIFEDLYTFYYISIFVSSLA